MINRKFCKKIANFVKNRKFDETSKNLKNKLLNKTQSPEISKVVNCNY